MQQVTITIAEGGETKIEVAGCAGPSCQTLTEGIERALGAVTSDVRTAEYFQSARQSQQAQARTK